MHGILTRANDDVLSVTFGGDVMTDWEIREQLFDDARFVAVAVAVAVVMLAIATRSVFLTVFALLQLLISFPIAYTLYRAGGDSSLTLIQVRATCTINSVSAFSASTGIQCTSIPTERAPSLLERTRREFISSGPQH
jgi:predicted RND superfamily exporter protein